MQRGHWGNLPWRTNVRNYEYLYKLRQFWPNLVQYVTAVSIRFDDNNFQNILNSRKKKLEIESLRSSGISWLSLAGQLIITPLDRMGTWGLWGSFIHDIMVWMTPTIAPKQVLQRKYMAMLTYGEVLPSSYRWLTGVMRKHFVFCSSQGRFGYSSTA